MSRFGIVPNPEHQAKNRSGRKTGQKRFSGQNKKRWGVEPHPIFWLIVVVSVWAVAYALALYAVVHPGMLILMVMLTMPVWFRVMYLIGRDNQ